MGLNESYNAIRSQILLMEPLPTVSQIYSLLLQEERHRNLHIVTLPHDAAALTVNRRGLSERPSMHCDHCKRDNHTIDRCFLLHGFPSKNNTRRQEGKFKTNQSAQRNTGASANARSTNVIEEQKPMPSISHEQYQHLIALLSTTTTPSNYPSISATVFG